jgi:Flp pilus assembly protein TadG
MRRTDVRSKQQGSALVELALLLPVLLLLGLMVAEGSNVIRTHQVLSNAAREGARLSTLLENRGNTGAIVTEVINYASLNGVTITSGNVTINQAVSITNGSSTINASSVTVNYTYTLRFLSAFSLLGVPTSYPLQGNAVFRNFY